MVSPCEHGEQRRSYFVCKWILWEVKLIPGPFGPITAPADLIGCWLVSAGVFISERPIEGGDVDTAAGFAHQTEPGVEDGWVSGAGVKLQTCRDALHQNKPDQGGGGGEREDRLVTES